MKQKTFSLIFSLILASAWLPLTGQAQEAAKLPRLGWLGNYSATTPVYDAFRQGLRELGYIDGKNIIIEARWADGKFERLPGFARELALLKVDVFLVGSEIGLKAAKEASATIPIVVVTCDPLDKLVASIARPGGKATGLTCISSEISAKRLQLLKEVIPQLTRVAVLYNSADHDKVSEYNDLVRAAANLNLTLWAFEASSGGEISAAFPSIMGDQAQALVILSDLLMNFHIKTLANLALKYRLPTIYGFREFADAGGLISYGANRREQLRRAASYIDKILKGSDPSDLPVELPTKFELVINLKTAKTLGLTIPPALITTADEVIE